MTDALTVRLGTLDDIPVMIHQRRAMFEAMGYDDHDTLDQMDAGFREWVRDKLLKGEYICWLAVDGDRPAAGAAIWIMEWPPTAIDISARRAYLLNVYAEPQYRRRGLARRLVAVILDWCRQQGIKVVGLHASEEGRPLYETFGFKPTNEMRLLLYGSSPEDGLR